VLITAVTAGLAAFGAQLWVPVALALATLLEFLIAYQQLESRIPASNACIATLTGLLTHWNGVSLIAKRMPRNTELLVNTTETALLLKHEAFVQAALKLDIKEGQHGEHGEESEGHNSSAGARGGTSGKQGSYQAAAAAIERK
jgi:hypothetical protein